MVSLFFNPRPFWLLLLMSAVIGAALGLAVYPLPMIAGTSRFWDFATGNSINPTFSGLTPKDTAQVWATYLYFVKAPWSWPLLQAPLLGPPPGTNVFFGDVVPWVALVGKLLSKALGFPINPYGFYLFASLVAPGCAMTALLATAGQRNLAAAIFGSILTDTTPYLLFRWGHIALSSHFLVIMALGLYLRTGTEGISRRTEVGWNLLLAGTFLTNAYLLVLVGACRVAALLQKLIAREASLRKLAISATVSGATVLGLAIPLGVFGQNNGPLGDWGFGHYSMNLLSPMTPQMSGLFPELRDFRVGMPFQYEGFSYLGVGILLLASANARGIARWLQMRWRTHLALLSILGLLLLFALSNRIYFGSRLVAEINLGSYLEQHIFGMFRSSGRFFWLVGYAFVAVCILSQLRNFTSRSSLALLAAAGFLQVVDVSPLRDFILREVSQDPSVVLGPERLKSMIAGANAVWVFPTFGCVDPVVEATNLTPSEKQELKRRLWIANVEIELASAQAYIRTNTVYVARHQSDCPLEAETQRQIFLEGALYIYLMDYEPSPAQIAGKRLGSVCKTEHWARYCRVDNGETD